MADVSRPWGDDDRGQLFLVAGLTLAVLFVSLALLLNTAIYTENLATRNTDPGTDPSIGYRHATEDAVTGIMIRTNENHTDLTPSEVEDQYRGGVANWSDAQALHSAHRTRVTSVSVDSVTRGTRIEQTNVSREFTNQTGNATDWPLASDDSVRNVQFTVEQSELESDTLGGILSDDPFRLRLESTSSSKEWSVYIYRVGTDEVEVAVMNDTATETCSASLGGDTHAVVDISGGHINDTACPEFGQTLDLGTEEVDVSFENGDKAVGTYHLIIDDGLNPATNPHVVDNEVDGSPFVTAVVYSSEVTITYQSTDVYYTTTYRAAPGEIR